MILSLIACAVLGAVFGSFAGVVTERMYTGQSWFSGRSRCDSCGHTLGGLDLVPVLSFLLSGGTCRACGARISLKLLIVELVMAALFALAYSVLGLSFALAAFLLTLVTLCVIVLYDLRHTVVPPVASTMLGVFSLLYVLLTAHDAHRVGEALLWAGGIGLAFLCLHLFSAGRAMGLGDAPVAMGLSLLVAPYAFGGLLLSFWIGAFVGIMLLVLRRRGPTMGMEVPFVPFLALGFLLAFFIQWNPLLLTL